MRKTLWIGLVAVVAFFASSSSTRAITITEHTVEINAKPGDVIERKLDVYDDSLQGAKLYVSVMNFKEDPSSPGTATLITDAGEMRPDRSWITLGAETLDVPASGTLVPFTYTIQVPADADPGTHLLSIVFKTQPPAGGDQGSTVSIGSNIVDNIFLKVAGSTIDQIEAQFQVGTFTNTDPGADAQTKRESFKTKSFFWKPPVDFLVEVMNKGNTHQKPDGNIKIQNDLFGQSFEKIGVNTQNNIILPGGTRYFEVDSFGKGLMFGKYRAKLTLIYGSPLREFTTEVDFWIVPVVEIAIALGVLIVIIVLIILIRKLMKRRQQLKEKEKEEQLRKTLREEIKQSMKESQDETSSKSNTPGNPPAIPPNQ